MEFEDYKRYGYGDDTPIINKDAQWKEYFDSKFGGINNTEDIDIAIKNSIDASMEHIHSDICRINCNVNHSKCEIIDEIHNIQTPCLCNVATKEDIQNAVKEINSFTEAKFESFEDLNQMVREINEKI